MHEGMTVPEGAVPASAWGMSAAFMAPADVARHDPFDGRGLRIDLAGLPSVTLLHVQETTGITQAVLFAGVCAWADLGEGNAGGHLLSREEVQGRWDRWREGLPPLA
jgi:hypothetical protein